MSSSHYFLPHKIHYQIFDALGRVERVLVDNDASVNKAVHTGESERDNAGQPVTDIDQVLRYDYNLKGELIELKKDNNVDGTYDYREVYTLDEADGRIKQKDIDLTNDGKYDFKEIYDSTVTGGTLDSDGSIKGLSYAEFYNVLYKENGEKVEILTKKEYYKPDANNNNEETKRDILGDGTDNSITNYILEAGKVREAHFDTDGNGEFDRAETYYRENGHIVRTEVDNGNNNSTDIVRHYVRDALGRVRVESIDENNDTIIDTRYERTYDNFGRQDTSKTFTYNPDTKQMEQTASWEKTFDTNGNPKTMVYPDHTIVFDYDDYGRITREVAEAFNRDWRYTHNQDGTVATRTSHAKDGSVLDKLVYTSYYEHSKISKEAELYDANDKLVRTLHFTRSDNGTIMNTLIDLAENGKGWDTYTFGDANRVTSLNNSQDLTAWSSEKLAELGDSLSLIRMAHGATSILTLNAEVVAKISDGGLKVEGARDNKPDTLKLSGFVQESSTEAGYNLYTATVNGEDLNLYVQDNIVMG